MIVLRLFVVYVVHQFVKFYLTATLGGGGNFAQISSDFIILFVLRINKNVID